MEMHQPGAGSWRRASLVLTLIACSAVLFVRKSDSFTRPQFWAEDGPVYFQAAREEGVQSLLKPHNGSLYLFQRVVAWAGSGVPVRYAPHYYNYAALAATLGVVVYVLRSRTDLNMKWLFALAVVASPHEGEVFLSLTNVHWVLSLALVFALLSDDPKSGWGAALEGGMVFVLCLSGPFVVLLLPFFLLRAARRRSAYSMLLAGIAIACFSLALRHLNADRATGPVNIWSPLWLNLLGDRISGLLFLGNGHAGMTPSSAFQAGLSALVYGVLIGSACIRRDKACLIILGVACLVLSATAYGYRGMPALGGAPRYCYVPAVCLVWALIQTMNRGRMMALPARLALVMVGISSVYIGKWPPLPDLHWAKNSKGVGGPAPWHVPINPLPWAINYRPPGRMAEDVSLTQQSVEASQGIGWRGEEQCIKDGSCVNFKLNKPMEVLEATIEYRIAGSGCPEPDLRLSWRRLGSGVFQPDDQSARVKRQAPDGRTCLIIWIFDTIDGLRLEPRNASIDLATLTVRLRTLRARNATALTMLEER